MRSNTPSDPGITPRLKTQIGISFQTLDTLRTQPHVPEICLQRWTTQRLVDLSLTPRCLQLGGRQPASPSLLRIGPSPFVLARTYPGTVRVSTCDSSGDTRLPLATGKGCRNEGLRQKRHSKMEIRMRPYLTGGALAPVLSRNVLVQR
jgi:hypothetical protein